MRPTPPTFTSVEVHVMTTVHGTADASAARPIPRRTDSSATASATSSASGTPHSTSFSPPHFGAAAPVGFGSLEAIEEVGARAMDASQDDMTVPMGTPIPPATGMLQWHVHRAAL